MDLLCDEMLRGFGRWLRAAGHDTVIAEEGADDRDLLARALREERVMLTCDRHLADIAPARARVVFLRPDGLDAQAHALRKAMDLDWRLAPFTRCMVDNAVLRPAGPHHLERVPPASRERAGGTVRICPACGRIYWPGGHVRRMSARLAAWQGEAKQGS